MPIGGRGSTSKFNTGGKGGNSLEAMTQEQNAANKAREEEIRKMYDEIIGMYQPGGGFGAGAEAMLERQKQRDIAASTQQMISSGLYGSTVAAALPAAWEETVGSPARLKLEDMRYGALTEAMNRKAQFVENIQNTFPDYGLFAQLGAQSAPISGLTSSGTLPGTTFGKGVGPMSSGIRTTPPTQHQVISGYYGGQPRYETVTY